MKSVLLVVLSVIALVYLVECKTQWHQLESYNFQQYVSEFSKRYNTAELSYRQSIFEKNLQYIRDHNNDNTKSWKLGVNHMTDWSSEEFSRLLGYKKGAVPSEVESIRSEYVFSGAEIPDHRDWRQYGVISPVKDQGQCGSCWTFATAETIESYWALKTGELNTLSEQQVLDCTPNPNQCGGTGGCGGGTTELAYAQIIKTGGLSSEWTYPYQSYWGKNFNCHFNETTTPPVAVLKKFTVLPSNKYDPVLEAIATVGPLAISVDASTWQHYESGVYNGCNQTNPDIDHAVQLVGYGKDDKLGEYWLVRNSWTPAWGESGYIRLYRTSKVECGIDLTPSDGDGCANGPPTVTACGTCAILYDVNYVEVSAH